MIAEAEYPVSKGEIYQPKDPVDFRRTLALYCCFFDVTFYGIREKILWEHPISASKCRRLAGEEEDNGRIVCADVLSITISGVDFDYIQKFYEWDRMEIGTLRRYRKGRLPREFVLSILKLYEKKTALKGVEGMERDYQASKEMINSAYGNIIMDVCRKEYLYEGSAWEDVEALDFTKKEELIRKYNESPGRFIFYPWGCIVTALCRRRLLNAIAAVGVDYVYSDTDSIKFLHPDRYKEYFDRENEEIREKTRLALFSLHIPQEMAAPKNKKGEEKPIGVFEFEGVYDRFKTLGAKRYAFEKDGNFSITVSGVNKFTAAPYLINKYRDRVFDAFSDDLEIPKGAAGKMTHTYIDDEMVGEAADYLGNRFRYYEKSGVHLEEAAYSLSIAEKYMRYLLKIKERKLY